MRPPRSLTVALDYVFGLPKASQPNVIPTTLTETTTATKLVDNFSPGFVGDSEGVYPAHLCIPVHIQAQAVNWNSRPRVFQYSHPMFRVFLTSRIAMIFLDESPCTFCLVEPVPPLLSIS